MRPFDVAIDSAGDRFVTGSFSGTVDFDPGAGTVNKTANSRDIFIAKYSSSGALLWVDQIGGTGDDDAFGITLDGTSNVWVTGSFGGTVDFDPGPGTANLSSGVGTGVFALRLNTNGGYLGSVGSTSNQNSRNQGIAIATDSQNNAYITGEIGTVGSTSTFGGTNLSPVGTTDIFVAKVTPSGNNLAFAWAKSFPSANASSVSQGDGIAADASGHVYVTGTFSGTVNYPSGALTSTGGQDAFVAQLDQASGNTLRAQKFGAGGFDVGDSVAVDAAQNVFVSGHYEGTVGFGGATAPLTAPVGGGIFVLKLNPALQPLAATDLGATNQLRGLERGTDLAIDRASGDVVVTGQFSGTAHVGGHTFNSAGGNDLLVAQLNNAGAIIDARSGGGIGNDLADGIALNSFGTVALLGEYEGTATFGASTLPSFGAVNMVVAQLSLIPSTGPARTTPGDFDGDGRTDYAVYERTTGKLYVLPANHTAAFILQFGPTNGIAAPGDYDGDHRADYAVYESSTSKLYVLPANGSGAFILQFGPPNGIPTPGDYDGDGKTDYGVYEKSTSKLYIRLANGSGAFIRQFGPPNGIPTPGDYDGDHKTDYAVYERTTGKLYVLPANNSAAFILQFGPTNGIPTPGDYDGDGKTDYGVYEASTSKLYILLANHTGAFIRQFGPPNGIPTPGDYDNDGKTDYAVYESSTGKLYVLPANNSAAFILQFGPTNANPYLNPIRTPTGTLSAASVAQSADLTDTAIDTLSGDATTSFLSLPADARRKKS